jgi:dienelactone hydrolase
VVVWHWKDPRIQSQQEREKAQAEAYAYASAYYLNTKRFVRLADDKLRDVIVAPHDRYAIGWESDAYETDNWMSGRHYVDLYGIEVSSGEKRLLAKRFLLVFGIPGRVKRFFPSPDGVHVVTWADSAYQVRDLRTAAAQPLTAKGGPTFGTLPNDYSPHKAPVEPVAWSQEGDVVVLSDGWDLWAVPIDGRAPTNLTVDGRRMGVKYGRPLTGLIGIDPIIGYGTATVDMSKPWYANAMGYWTTENGIIRIDGSRPGAHRLLWGEMGGVSPIKARDADVVAFPRGSVVEYPNYYLTNLSFSKPRKVTDANPQQRQYLWPSGVVMVNYRGPSGGRLQAAVWLPANYEKGKRYPAIVSIYERESFMRSHYAPPFDEINATGTGVDPTTYASRGYAIIFPDIAFDKGRPGTSALHCVLAAARAAVAAGIVDSTRVGLTGHSWGGYESSFVPTQTSFFKAVVTAAPITDMVSEYGLIYWGSGQMLSAQAESDQLRMGKPYWEDPQRYIRESAVFHVDKVTTPILLVHNDKDDAVDWRQGIEYYNALRRAKKPVVMLQYVGQGHGTGGSANIKDLKTRTREFFDHFLMGQPAPKWWTSGVPNRDMEQYLTEPR